MGRTAANPTTDRSWAPWRRRGGSDADATAARPGRQSLQSRILSRALLISVVPLLLISSVTLGSLLGLSNSAANNLEQSRQQLGRDVAGRAVRANAVGVAREMEQLVAERVDDLIGLAATPDIRRAARGSADGTGDALAAQPTGALEAQFNEERRLSPGSAIERFVRATTRSQPMLTDLVLTERNGLNVATSGRPSDFVQRDETWWKRAWSDGLFLGDVVAAESSDTTGQTVAVRIDSSSGERLGVLRAIIDISQLQQIASRTAADTGTEVSVVTGDGQLLAETRTDHDLERIANDDVELDDDITATVETALDDAEPGFALQDAVVTGYAPLSVADGRLAALVEPYEGVDTEPLRWVVVVDQDNGAAFAPLQGLAGVQRGLNSTARTFVVIIVVTLIAALIAAFLVATRLAQRIVGPLRSLGAVARDIAERQLPALVRHAQRADSDAELPSVPAVQLHTNDEIEDVADAFNIVSNTAADLAAEQARSRRNVARMFVSLGRRNQNLLSRQLEFIDRLERDTADPDLLEDLFRLDHLATRMRRNAESLLVLAGEDPPRRWAEPVSLADAVRGAVGEIEDYQRVNIDGVDEASLVGTAVSDVAHLIAELIENATQFSPPDSQVAVVGRRVVEGYALAVVDDGVGMSAEELEDANRRLEMSPLVDRVPSSYLGLFVVGRLAARHGIRVRLVESTTEGVTAKVLLPTALVEPLPRAVPSRELSDVERRPALAARATAGVGARGGLARLARTGGESSTAVIDVPVAPPPADEETQDERTQRIAPGLRRRERTAGRTPGRRGVQIDLRDPADDGHGPDGDAPSPPPSDADDEVGAEGSGRDDAGGEEPRGEEAGSAEPVSEDESSEGQSNDEPGSEDLSAEAHGTEDPSAEDPSATEDRSAEDRSAEDHSATEDQSAEDHSAEDHSATEDHSAEDRSAEDRSAEDHSAEDHSAEDHSAEDHSAEDHSTGEPGGEESRGDGPTDTEPSGGDAADDEGDGGVAAALAAAGRNASVDLEQPEQPGSETPADDGSSAAVGDAPPDPEADTPRPVIKVRRRTSKRGRANGRTGGDADGGPAVLRTERSVPQPTSGSEEAAGSAMSERAGITTSITPEIVDEDGVALTASEREARAARDRLASFQRAVRQGRAKSKSGNNGGDDNNA